MICILRVSLRLLTIMEIGELPDGEYRIVRRFYEPEKEDIKYYTVAEFSIE